VGMVRRRAWTGILKCRRGRCVAREAGTVFVIAMAALLGAAPVGAQPRPAGSCTRDGWCWESPTPQGNDLHGVWGSGPKDVWAVGALGTVLRYDGAAWRRVESGVQARLLAVWGASSTEVWIAGEGVVLRWDGRRLGKAAVPGPLGTLRAIWGRGARDVWIVGDGTTLRWDGKAWARVATEGRVRLAALAGSATEIWAGGEISSPPHRTWEAYLARFDGTRWATVTPPAGSQINALAIATHDLLVVQGGRPALHRQSLLRARAGGGASRWERVQLQSSSVVSDVWLDKASGHLWLAGGDGLMRWDGASWLRFAAPPSQQLRALWGSRSEIWAVGQHGALARWNGATLGAGSQASDLQLATFHRDAAGTLWAAGEEGAVAKLTATGWVKHSTTPAGLRVLRLAGSSEGDLWAAANIRKGCGFDPGHASVLRWDGRTWTRARELPGYALTALISAGPGDVWAAAREDRIPAGPRPHPPQLLHLVRGAWRRVPLAGVSTILDLWSRSPRDVWLLAPEALLRWDGARWASHPLPELARYRQPRRLSGSSSDVWIVCGSRVVLRFDGRSFTTLLSDADGSRLGGIDELSAVLCTTTGTWVAGRAGALLRWDGKAWSRPQLGSGADLVALGFDGKRLWVAGSGGALLRR
jgi:hypothetical protein